MPIRSFGLNVLSVTMTNDLRELLLDAIYASYTEDVNLDALNEYLEQISFPRFAKLHGYACPFCGSTCVDCVGDLVLKDHAFQHTSVCRLCDSDWMESYDMTGYLSSDGV